MEAVKKFVLDGTNLTPEIVLEFGENLTAKIALSPSAINEINLSRAAVDKLLSSKETVYGLNTGFGNFQNIVIDNDALKLLQENLIRSHACGTGNYLSVQCTRMMLLLRVSSLAQGCSGVSLETMNKLIEAFNENIISCVPEKGTVGASGDLAPLAHLILGLMGEGDVWDINEKPPKPVKAEVVLKDRYKPLVLQAKEGLALINGTQFMTALGCEALVRSKNLCKEADVVAAMTIEALRGLPSAFDYRIHSLRRHKGQQVVAERLRSYLHSEKNPSTLYQDHEEKGRNSNDKKIRLQNQDAYSLRCIPQVHGIVNDTVEFVENILTNEINSVTDNPLIFYSGWDSNTIKDECRSGGNFHGEYPAKSLDYLAIAIHELGNISERRIERLLNPDLNRGLPAFLIEDGGLNSGLMIPQYVAAALVSENKVLTHPSSVDSISTSAATEDHVSMGGFAARKVLQVLQNVETILAIELLCSCQAIDLLHDKGQPTPPLKTVHEMLRKKIPMLKKDEYLKPYIDAATTIIKTQQITKSLNQNHFEEYDEKENDDQIPQSLKCPKGTRDYSPGDMVIRDKIMSVITNKFKVFGGQAIETPVFELRDILMKKYGEDEKLIYELMDEDETGEKEKLCMRYDLTVPLARYVAMNRKNIKSPFKAGRVGKVYRRDQPRMTKGRYREFWQCDFDIVRTSMPSNPSDLILDDAEIVALIGQILLDLDIPKFKIKINNRKLLDIILKICKVSENNVHPISSAIDKLGKKSWIEVKEEMITKGISEESAELIKKYIEINGDPHEVLKKLKADSSILSFKEGEQALLEFELLLEFLGPYKCLEYIVFDMSMVRGLEYYTGVILEVCLVDEESGNEIGSISAGGRFDKLVSQFVPSGDFPCVGASIGFERVFTILQQKYGTGAGVETQILICEVSEKAIQNNRGLYKERLELLNELRNEGFACEFMAKLLPSFRDQIAYAEDRQIPLLLILGEDELKNGTVSLRRLLFIGDEIRLKNNNFGKIIEIEEKNIEDKSPIFVVQAFDNEKLKWKINRKQIDKVVSYKVEMPIQIQNMVRKELINFLKTCLVIRKK